MSHAYVQYTNNDPQQPVLQAVYLSNTSHEGWQEKAELARDMRNTETGEVVQFPFNTTIHDAEPLSLCMDEFEDFMDKAQEKYGDTVPEHMQLLYDLCASGRALEDETGVDLRIFIY